MEFTCKDLPINKIMKKVIDCLTLKEKLTREEIEYKHAKNSYPISKSTWDNYKKTVSKKAKTGANSMTLDNFYNICLYTGVSADYFLGFKETKLKEVSAQTIKEEFGLSDEAMERLIKIKRKKREHFADLTSDAISLILANDKFWNEIEGLLPTYFDEEYLNEHNDYNDYRNMIKFELSEAFIKLIDDVCKSLLIAAAEAEKKGISIFDKKNGRSAKSIIEECKERDWVILKDKVETVTEETEKNNGQA